MLFRMPNINQTQEAVAKQRPTGWLDALATPPPTLASSLRRDAHKHSFINHTYVFGIYK